MKNKVRKLIAKEFEIFNQKLFNLGVELDDHAEFCSILRDINSGKVVASVYGNKIEEWYNILPSEIKINNETR